MSQMEMLGARFCRRHLTVAALSFLLSGCMGLYLDEISSPQPDYEMCRGRYRVTILKCPKDVDRLVVADLLKERMGDSLVSVTTSEDDPVVVSSSTGDDTQVLVSIDSSEDDHWVWPLIVVLPSLSSWWIIPTSGTVSRNLQVDLSAGSMHASAGLQYDRTFVISSLPWSYLPLLWHDDGFMQTSFDEDAGTTRESEKRENWEKRWVGERVALAVAVSLKECERKNLKTQAGQNARRVGE